MINTLLNIAVVVLYSLITYFVIMAIKTHKMMREYISKQMEVLRKDSELLDLEIRKRIEQVDISKN